MLYSSPGTQTGTYYYSTNKRCPGEPNGYPELDGYPTCISFTPGTNQKTLRQINSNNIVAIDSNILSNNRGRYCGKQVNIYKNGVKVAAPDQNPDGSREFYVFDGCQACIGGGRIDLSVNGLQNVDPNACNLGVVPGVTWQVVDKVVATFNP